MSLMILSHGKESGPNASKITRLDALATTEGWRCVRPDYGTTASPSERLVKLAEVIAAEHQHGEPLVLMGSSMGAYISALMSLDVSVSGLFLLAPPVFFGGREPPIRMRCPQICMVHGWNDELIDAGEAVAFARSMRCKLVLVNDGHRLSESMPDIEAAFAQFLQNVRNPNPDVQGGTAP